MREHGIEEYLLWNAGNRYTSAALIPPKSTKKKGETDTKKPASPAASTTADTGETATAPAPKVAGAAAAEDKSVSGKAPVGSPTPAATR